MVPIQQQRSFAGMAERSERRLGAAVHRAVRFNQMDRRLKILTRQFRVAPAYLFVLKWQVIDTVLCRMLPTSHPDRAEVAVPIVDEKGLLRRGGNLDGRTHTRSLPCIETLRQQDRAGRPVRGSMMWCNRSPARSHARPSTLEVARPPSLTRTT